MTERLTEHQLKDIESYLNQLDPIPSEEVIKSLQPLIDEVRQLRNEHKENIRLGMEKAMNPYPPDDARSECPKARTLGGVHICSSANYPAGMEHCLMCGTMF
jgi:hypothetical protein